MGRSHRKDIDTLELHCRDRVCGGDTSPGPSNLCAPVANPGLGASGPLETLLGE